ncbi:Lrp/AsnC family transcriptional regulator [Paenarthrobacter sp. NCHU4564]|uniref:Lrp/AsnC family transcriptional regulator n=1 Tax=Paenarthrobacter sp. NCHU4564 TaxID=3451353 RepID=UPI003F987EEF
MIDHLDLQLITALQTTPRISWAKLGGILNVDASTLSRRWNRLLEERLAWTSCFFMPEMANLSETRIGAFVEVGCVPGTRDGVIEVLAQQTQAVSVLCTSGTRDLYVIFRARTFLEIDDYVQRHIAVIPGVSSTRTHIVRSLFKEGSSWRVPVLTPAQVSALEETLPRRAGPKLPSEDHLALLEALHEEIRMPVSALQKRLGVSLSSVSRSIDALLSVPWVKWRVDFAYTYAGWSCTAMLWMSIEQTQIRKVASALTSLPPVRWCASTSGESNLVASMRLKDLEELDVVEAKLQTAFPGLQVRDRWIVPRIAKMQGHLLDETGRHRGYVPL